MIAWRTGTLVETKMASEHVMSLTFEVPDWPGHEAGQHCDILLVAPNGYRAERSYSIATAPARPEDGPEVGTKVEFGVVLLPDGEVSPYLWKMQPGQQLNLRGPIGRHFTWDHTLPGPLVLIGGGSGMVPLVSMLRHYVNHRQESAHEVIVIESGRTQARLLYRDELDEYAKQFPEIKIIRPLTDQVPPNWSGLTGRVNATMLEASLASTSKTVANIYVCGATSFVELVADTLVTIGFNTTRIKTERFG